MIFVHILNLFFLIFCMPGLASEIIQSQYIVKEDIPDPRHNNTDTRFLVNTTDENYIQNNEIQLLHEFANMPTKIAVIICNKQNIDFMKKKVSDTQNSYAIVRYYNNIPMILNVRANNLLPRLNGRNEKLSAFTVVIADLDPDVNSEDHDYRMICMKDRRVYGQFPAGATEYQDFEHAESYKTVLTNSAYRELVEEIDLSTVTTPEQLRFIGIFKFMAEKKLIDTKWNNIFAAFYYRLGKLATTLWLEKINIASVDRNVPCDAQRITNNDETQWLFFIKPEMFSAHEINLPLENGKTASIGTLHADVGAVVLNKIFHFDNVYIGRGNRYLDGELTCSNLEPLFSESFPHLKQSDDFNMNF